MKRSLVFFLLGLGFLLLAMTLAAETVIVGPVLITITFFTWGYSLFFLYQTGSKWGRLILNILAELFTWPI